MQAIAKAHGVHPALIALKWAHQRGEISIPFSVHNYASNLKCVTEDPLTEEEMAPLGIKPAELEIDFEEGDTVTITAGVWKDTVGVIQSINPSKQIVTINVELFGRETPVEIGFTEIKKM